jgi:hypothetical protein
VLDTSVPSLRLRTDLPPQLQVVTGRTATRTVVHLLNRSGDAAQRFVAPVEIAPGTLQLPAWGEPRTVRGRVCGEELDWKLEGEAVLVRTPPVRRFEVLDVEWHDN